MSILALWIPRFFIDTQQHQQYYQAVILTLTLLAILWYTLETRRMQNAVTNPTAELICQRRISRLPKLSARSTRSHVLFPPQVVDVLELVNIGNGTAVNIVVDDLKLRYEENEYARIRFGELLYLEPAKNNSNSERSAHVRIFSGNVVAIPPNDPAEWATWAIPEEFNPRPVEFLQGVEGDRLLPLELGTPRVQKRESRS